MLLSTPRRRTAASSCLRTSAMSAATAPLSLIWIAALLAAAPPRGGGCTGRVISAPPSAAALRRGIRRPAQPRGRRASAVGATSAAALQSCFVVEPPRLSSRRKATTTAPTSTARHLQCKSFDEMLNSHGDTPLLIDFYASWCGPCKLMKSELSKVRPELEKLGPMMREYLPSEDGEGGSELATAEGTARAGDDVAKRKQPPHSASEPSATGIATYHVNTNRFPQVGARNAIHGLPTLVLFYEGEEVWRNEGFMMGKDVLGALQSLQEGGCWEKIKKQKEARRVKAKEVEMAGQSSSSRKKRRTRGLGD